VSVEFNADERDKLRRLAKFGSPPSRTAARKLLFGEIPTAHEVACLSKTLSRASWRAAKDDHHDRLV
jgi:hypothetical protein